jgi:Protein of unknown function (DUF1236)
MKNSLWITTAAAALVASSFAVAQDKQDRMKGQNAPAATQSQSGGAGMGTTGQGSQGGATTTQGGGQTGAAEDSATHPSKKGPKGAAEESHPKKGQKTGQDQPKKSGTTGQGTGTQERGGQGTRPQAQPQSPPSGQGTGTQTAPTRQGAGTSSQTNVNVQINPEQRTRIREVILKGGHAPKVTRSEVNFSIRVGTRVPRERIHLVPVPEEIVQIVPRYRGFLYFVFEDEIVIVDPKTLEIVAVIAT